MGRSLQKLTDLFRKLEAPDPEAWAKSEIREGIPQWIQAFREDARRDPKAPLAGVGLALERLIAAGASPADLSDVVRGMQYTTLFSLLYLLSDPGDLEEEVEGMGWVLLEADSEGKIGKPMEGLHEDALHLDPGGREMRPR